MNRVRVEDRGERTREAELDRGPGKRPGVGLFTDPLEDQHVGVDGHSYREDDPRQPGKGERFAPTAASPPSTSTT